MLGQARFEILNRYSVVKSKKASDMHVFEMRLEISLKIYIQMLIDCGWA